MLVEPHPLDFDWRFTVQTRRDLGARLGAGAILACGTPTLVPHLEQNGATVVLVDRNPFVSVGALGVDIGRDVPLKRHGRVVVMDPPWYLAVLARWLTWGANHLEGGVGTVWSTLWPDETRPTAAEEKATLLQSLRSWAEPQVYGGVLRYEVPAFEAAARRAGGVADADVPWRTGDLLELRVHRIPEIAPPLPRIETWKRFVFDQYQLALRITPFTPGRFDIVKHPHATNWTWPSVSRRAPFRDKIDLWSSRNEVAMVVNAPRLAEVLARAVESRDTALLAETLHMTDWHIPHARLKRTATWTHHE